MIELYFVIINTIIYLYISIQINKYMNYSVRNSFNDQSMNYQPITDSGIDDILYQKVIKKLNKPIFSN